MSETFPSSAQRSWLRNLPKCELHLHLEGTIEPETLVALSKRHDVHPLSLEDARGLYEYDGFLGFLSAFSQVTQRLQSADDYELITFDMVKSLADQGVRHAEVYITLNRTVRSETLDVESVMAAVERGRQRGEKEYGTTVFWIIDAARQFSLEESATVFRKAAELKTIYPSVVGIGIAGNEAGGPAANFAELFHEAKQAGLRVTAHAGEAMPSSSVWDAVKAGAERIGHGLTAVSDPELLAVLKKEQIPLELCVTSNICTRSCPSVDQHPFKQYFDEGLQISINSDDPPMFQTTLLDEYELVQHQFGLSNEHMMILARNSIASSFLSDERKSVLIEELKGLAQPVGSGSRITNESSTPTL